MPIVEGPLSGRNELMLEMRQAVQSVMGRNGGLTSIDHFSVYKSNHERFVRPRASSTARLSGKARRQSDAQNPPILATVSGRSATYSSVAACNIADRIIYPNHTSNTIIPTKASGSRHHSSTEAYDPEEEALIHDAAVVSPALVSIATFINPF
jgi:hypothetical protein